MEPISKFLILDDESGKKYYEEVDLSGFETKRVFIQDKIYDSLLRLKYIFVDTDGLYYLNKTEFSKLKQKFDDKKKSKNIAQILQIPPSNKLDMPSFGKKTIQPEETIINDLTNFINQYRSSSDSSFQSRLFLRSMIQNNFFQVESCLIEDFLELPEKLPRKKQMMTKNW